MYFKSKTYMQKEINLAKEFWILQQMIFLADEHPE